MNHDRRVKRVGDGWGFVVRVGGRGGRQYRRQGFPTARAANDALRELFGQADAGVPVSKRGQAVTVGEFLAERWLPSLPGRIRESTEDGYRRIVRLHLIPHIGGVALVKLTGADIEAMLGKLTTAGLSAATRQNVRACLSVAMNDARRWRLIAANPVGDSRNPQVEPSEPRAWTVEQLGVFLAAVASDRLAAVWRLLALTGMRRGELLGLRWGDIDFERGTATIVRQRTPVGGKIVEGAPKTRSGRRTLSVDTETLRALRSWRAAQTAELVRLGVRPDPLYVVTNLEGRPLYPVQFSARFRAICKAAGLPCSGVHGLRHTAATYWIGQGVSPRTVQQRLGHSDVGVTLRVYSHVLPGDDQRAVDALAAALESPKANPGVTNV